MKLTEAQDRLLRDIDAGAIGVDSEYRPAKKLVELGLAFWKLGKYSDILRITEAGRALLRAEGETP